MRNALFPQPHLLIVLLWSGLLVAPAPSMAAESPPIGSSDSVPDVPAVPSNRPSIPPEFKPFKPPKGMFSIPGYPFNFRERPDLSKRPDLQIAPLRPLLEPRALPSDYLQVTPQKIYSRLLPQDVTLNGWSLRNNGRAPAGAFTVRVVLLSIPTDHRPVDGYDLTRAVSLWSRDIQGLREGESLSMPSISLRLAATTSAGTYRLGVIVDLEQVVSEQREDNNSLWTFPLVVIPPTNSDLTVATGLVGVGDVAAPTYPSANATLGIAPDGDLVVTYGIANLGTETAAPVTVAYYLSPDPVVTTDDIRLGSRQLGRLRGGGTLNVGAHYVRLPRNLVAGDYYFGVIVDPDGMVDERFGRREENNVLTQRIRLLNTASDDREVFRARLLIVTGSGTNDGTNAEVFAYLNETQRTRLDYAHNDFQRNTSYWYDLVLDGVTTLRDIKSLKVLVNGNDGMCVDKLRLEVYLTPPIPLNGQDDFAIAEVDFPGCKWVERGQIASVDYMQLRSSAEWGVEMLWERFIEEYSVPARDAELGVNPAIKATAISSLIQANIGNLMGRRYSKNALAATPRWGSSGKVTLARYQYFYNSLQIVLNLTMEIENFPDLDAELGIVVAFGCPDTNGDGQGDRIATAVPRDHLYVLVDSAWYTFVWDWLADSIVEHKLEKAIRKEVDEVSKGLALPSGLGGLCPRVTADASVELVPASQMPAIAPPVGVP